MKKDGRKEKGERVKEGWGGGGKKGGRALKGCAPPPFHDFLATFSLQRRAPPSLLEF